MESGGGGTISLPFWPNGKEGNIRGGAAENDDCDYGRAGWKAKKNMQEEMSVDALPSPSGFCHVLQMQVCC